MTDEKENLERLERVARYLDGERLSLTSEEMLLVTEIRNDQQAVGRALDDVGDVTAVLAATRRRLPAAPATLAAPKRLVLRLAGLAAAAAVLVGALVLWSVLSAGSGTTGGSAGGKSVAQTGSGENSLAALANDVDSSDTGKLDLISAMTMDSEELDQVITLSNPDIALNAHLEN